MLRRIDKYDLESEIGRGGFGTVYKAVHRTLGSHVAIKILSPKNLDPTYMPQVLALFRREAESTAGLQHPNIVSVFDRGEVDGMPYLVMELLQGRTLEPFIRAPGSLDLLKCVSVMSKVAEALQYAHSCGVLHRDIKPANIMVLDNGGVKIMDFGIAKVITSGVSAETTAGFGAGSVAYMCPERFVAGAKATPMWDIWSYGTVYYELLVGQHPFLSGGGSDTLPRSAYPPGCPEQLQQLIQRTLAKNASLRYQTMEDIVVDNSLVLAELRKKTADDLLAEARRQNNAGMTSTARDLSLKVLELDPGNIEAQKLRQSILSATRRKSLMQQAEEMAADKRYQEAIQYVEMALQSAPSDTALTVLLWDLRTKQQKTEAVQRMTEEARIRLLSGDRAGALAILDNVLTLDSEAPKARELREQLQEDERQQARFQTMVDEMRQAAGNSDFFQATEILRTIQEQFGSRPDVLPLRQWLESEQATHSKRQSMKRMADEASAMLRSGQYSAVVSLLHPVVNDPVADRSLKQLYDFASEKEQERLREEKVRQALDTVNRLVEAGKMDEAHRFLRPLLEELPNEPKLKDAQRRIEEGRNREQGRAELDRLRVAASRAAASGRPDEGLRLIEQNRDRFAKEPAWLALLDREADEIRQMSRMAGVARWRSTIEPLLSSRNYAQALKQADAALQELPGEPILAALQQQAAAAVESQRPGANPQPSAATAHARQRRDTLADLLSKARLEASRKDFTAALNTLDSQAHDFADDISWQECRTSVETGRRQAQQREFVEKTQQRLQVFVDQGKYAEAIHETERALERFPNHSELIALRENARQMLRRQEELERQRVLDEQEREDQLRLEALAALQVRARKSLARRNFSEALSILDSEVGRFASSPSWQKLRAEIVQAEQDARRADALKRARTQVQALLKAGSIQDALDVVARASGQYPGEAEIAAIEDEIRIAQKAPPERIPEPVIEPPAPIPPPPPPKPRISKSLIAVILGVGVIASVAAWNLIPDREALSIEAKPASIEFRWKVGVAPPAQTIFIESNRPTPLKIVNDNSRLEVEPAEGDSPLALKVSVRTQGIAPSDDTISFQVETKNGKRRIPVRVHLRAEPAVTSGSSPSVPSPSVPSGPTGTPGPITPLSLQAKPPALEFRLNANGTSAAQTVTIAGNPKTPLKVINKDRRLIVQPTEGESPLTLWISARTPTTAQLNEPTSFQVETKDGKNRVNVGVRLLAETVVLPEISLDAKPPSLEFRWKVGSTPATKTLTIDSSRPTELKIINTDRRLEVQPAEGNSPLLLRVLPRTQGIGQLDETVSFQVETKDGKKRMNVSVHLVAEAEAVPVDPERALPTIRPSQDIKSYTGDLRGTLTWSGELAPKGRLVFRGGGVTAGQISGSPIPRLPVSLALAQSGVVVSEPPVGETNFDRLVIVNNSSERVRMIKIQWSVIQK